MFRSRASASPIEEKRVTTAHLGLRVAVAIRSLSDSSNVSRSGGILSCRGVYPSKSWADPYAYVRNSSVARAE